MNSGRTPVASVRRICKHRVGIFSSYDHTFELSWSSSSSLHAHWHHLSVDGNDSRYWTNSHLVFIASSLDGKNVQCLTVGFYSFTRMGALPPFHVSYVTQQLRSCFWKRNNSKAKLGDIVPFPLSEILKARQSPLIEMLFSKSDNGSLSLTSNHLLSIRLIIPAHPPNIYAKTFGKSTNYGPTFMRSTFGWALSRNINYPPSSSSTLLKSRPVIV